MVNSFRGTSFTAFLLVLASFATTLSSASAQETKAVSFLEHQLGRVNFAITGVGEFSKSVSGTNYLSQSVTLQPSKTVGYAGTLQYIRSPFEGLEIHYGYARYSQNFTLGPGPAPTTPGSPQTPAAYYGVQSNAKEYSAGYTAHTRHEYFGLTPFASAGLGTVAFQPTIGGGYGLPKQYRALYYYDAGVETSLVNHLGARASFRETFYNSPDFLTNYLIIHQHNHSYEPSFGVFLRF